MEPLISSGCARQRPNNSLQLTRLAGGNGMLPCLLGCAMMKVPLPEPPGS